MLDEPALLASLPGAVMRMESGSSQSYDRWTPAIMLHYHNSATRMLYEGVSAYAGGSYLVELSGGLSRSGVRNGISDWIESAGSAQLDETRCAPDEIGVAPIFSFD